MCWRKMECRKVTKLSDSILQDVSTCTEVRHICQSGCSICLWTELLEKLKQGVVMLEHNCIQAIVSGSWIQCCLQMTLSVADNQKDLQLLGK